MKCVADVAQHVLFSHRKAQIKVWAVKVSFDPRQFAHTVTYMDISTSSCSLQHQLSLKPGWFQLAEWAVNGWIQSAKMHIFRHFLSQPPLREGQELTFICAN